MGIGAFLDPMTALRRLGEPLTVQSSNGNRLARLKAVQAHLATERSPLPDIATGMLAVSLVANALTSQGLLAEIDDWPNQKTLTDAVRELGVRLGRESELPDHIELRRPDGSTLRLARAS